MRVRPFVPIVTILLTAGLAGPCPADVVLPSSAFSSGASGASFESNVRIFNAGPEAAVVVPILYDQATGETVTRPAITIPPRQQVRYDNVLSSLFARSAPSFGTIRFQTASTGLVVSSSVNNVNACGSGAISGQWLPGIDASQALTGGVLVQLAASASPGSGYRTNVVFFNPGAATATVSAKVRRGDGALLSTAALPSLAPNGFLQKRLDDGAAFPGVAGTTDTNLWLEFTADRPVLSFASVIHNVSGDPFAVVAVKDDATCPTGFSGPDCAFCTWTTAGAECQPRSLRDVLDVGAIKALTLEDLGWTLRTTRKVAGVTIYTGDWSGGVFPTYDKQGKSVDLTLREAAAIYVPDGYPSTAHANLGFVYAAHYPANLDSATAVTIARHFGMPVLYHGEYPNWRDAGYADRNEILAASFPILMRANPCSPADLVRGYFPLALAKTDMRAITLLQRLTERLGGAVRKVALDGFSKEGQGVWLAFQMDDRIDVGIPGGAPMEDRLRWGQFLVAATGCEAGSTSVLNIQGLADFLFWQQTTPAGAAFNNLYSVGNSNLPLLYPRVLLINGDVCMYNMHDGSYGMEPGAESGFLDSLAGRSWRYVRKATVEPGAGGEDGDTTSTTAVPILGAELLASGPDSERTLFPDILSASATMSGDSFVVGATASAATELARVWWAWSTDRVFSEPAQEPWRSVPMTAAGGGVWTSPPIAMPPGTVIAWYAEVGNRVTVGGTEYNRNHAAPIRFLRLSPDKQCAPTPVTYCGF